MTKPDRNKAFAVGALGAITLLIGVAVALSVQGPRNLDPDSPEGTVQGYYQAVLDGDETRAFSYFTADLRSKCLNDSDRPVRTERGVRIVITQIEWHGDETVVTVEVRNTDRANPLFGGSYDYEEQVELQQSEDRWLISRPPWPMWSFACQ